jgi:CRP-like cAMP-binding protein/ATP/ADP translocase
MVKRLTGKALQSVAEGFMQDREEYTKVLWLFWYLFCVVSASTLGRTAADTLFLSHFNPSQLSMMYLPQSAALIAAGICFQRFSTRLRLDRLIKGLVPVLSVAVLLSRGGVGFGWDWVYPVIYVAYDVFNFLMIVCFWQFATAVLDQRKAKRTIGLVGSGGIVGGIVSGFGLKLVVPIIGTANLISIYAVFQLLSLLAVYRIVRMCKEPDTVFAGGKPKKSMSSVHDTKSRTRENGLFRNVPHLKYVALMSATLVIALTFIDYQFKVILRGTLQNEALAGFMGSFHGFSGLLALGIQLFVAGKLLTRFGVMTAILIFPAALLAGSLGVLLMPVLAMAVLLKGSDKVLGDTIYSSVSQLIMFPISPEWRGRAKSFLDGVVRNGAKGVAGLSLIGISVWLTPGQMSYIILGLLICCIGAAIRVKGAYLEALLATLETKNKGRSEVEVDFMDPASRQLLIRALSSADKQQVLYALKVLKGLGDFDLTPYIPMLLEHPAAEVCAEALLFVEQTTPSGLSDKVEPLLESDSSRVRAQALVALAAYGLDEYIDPISDQLEHKEIEVKSGAIAGLIKYYSIEGMFRAVGKLKELIDSKEESERTAVAALFGQIGMQGFYKPLIVLLKDPSPQVRRRALDSASKLLVPELVPYLVELLLDSQARRQAIDALAAYDETTILPLLDRYFQGGASALHLPKVYERIGSQAAFDKLLLQYGSAGYELRSSLLEALLRMRKSIDRVDEKQVETLVLEEIGDYRTYAEQRTALQKQAVYADVLHTVEQLRDAMIERVFGLLGLLYEPRTLQAVLLSWRKGDARQQANAAEVIDQLLHGRVRMELGKVMSADEIKSRMPVSAEDQLLWLYEQQVEWLCYVIQFAAMKQQGWGEHRKVRERLIQDEAISPEWLAEHMEQIQLLKQVPLFSELEHRDLSYVALRLKPAVAAAGTILFHEKDPGDSLLLLRSGEVGVHRNGERVGQLGTGDCVGQTAILTQRLRTATLRAETAVQLWRLDTNSFYEMMFDRTGIAMEMMKLLSRRMREMLAQGSRETAGEEESLPVEKPGLADSETALALIAATTEETESQSFMDMIVRRVLILQRIHLFSRLSQEDFIRLAQLVEEVEYRPGQAICRVDDFGDCMYGIIEGSVRVHRGVETFATLGEGECFGEMALIDSGPRSADCTAMEHTVLLQIHRDQVFSFCFQNIDVMRSMLQVLAERLKGML